MLSAVSLQRLAYTKKKVCSNSSPSPLVTVQKHIILQLFSPAKGVSSNMHWRTREMMSWAVATFVPRPTPLLRRSISFGIRVVSTAASTWGTHYTYQEKLITSSISCISRAHKLPNWQLPSLEMILMLQHEYLPTSLEWLPHHWTGDWWYSVATENTTITFMIAYVGYTIAIDAWKGSHSMTTTNLRLKRTQWLQ